jgi:hypothetical protein
VERVINGGEATEFYLNRKLIKGCETDFERMGVCFTVKQTSGEAGGRSSSS